MSIRSTKRRSYGFVIAILMGCVGLAHAQSPITVTGKIVFQDGAPASGVSVAVKGAGAATASDADGIYRISAAGDGTLVFTLLGSMPQEVPINNRTVIDITLQDDVSALDEVVVVGYGTQKKVNLSGAVAQIDGEALANR